MNLGELFKTKRWKTFMGFVYGWGAAVVLIGALFKLEHWPYSGILLTIGLSTEALIFFLSAFEPPVEMPEWSKVYPELREDYELQEGETSSPKRGGLDQLLGNTQLTPELLDKVSKSLVELSNTARGISDISAATIATDMYVKNLGAASTAMNALAETNQKANQAIDKSVHELVNSYASTASKLSETSDKLSKTYEHSSKAIESGLSNIENSSKEYAQNLAMLNKNLTTLNSNFENQLQQTQAQLSASQKFNQDMEQMNSILSTSVEELKKYKANAEMLNKNLEALNTIYGNMLGAMNFKK